MDGKIDVERIAAHWLETSDEDYETMQQFVTLKNYHWALFIGHLVLEKLLKGEVVKTTGDHPPFTHNLDKLLSLTDIELPDEHLLWIRTITNFNLNARYDDHKRAFYKLCTPEYGQEWVEKISLLRQWIRDKH